MADPIVTFKLTADTKAVETALKQINAATAGVATSLKSVGEAGTQASAKIASLGEINRRQFDLSARLAKSALEDSRAQVDAIEAQDKAYQDLISTIRAAGQAEDARAQSSAGASAAPIRGETIGKIGQLAGLAGVAGGAQAGQAVSVIVEGQRALSLLGDVAKDVGAKAIAGGGALTTLATSAGTAVAGVTGLSVGLGTLAVVAAPVALALGGVALALAEIGRIGAEADKATQAYIAQRDALREVADAGLTTAQIIEARAAKELEASRAQADIEKNNAAKAAAFEDAQTRLGDGIARVVIATAEASGGFNALNADTERATKALADAQGAIAAYDTALADGTAAANDRKAATEGATAAEKDLISARQQAAAQLANLEQQERDLLAAFAETQARRAEDLARAASRESESGALKIARANEDLNATLEAQQAAHNTRMTDISEAGDAALEALQASITDKQVEAARSIVVAQENLAKETGAAAAKYQREELARLDQFNADKARRDRDFRQREQTLLENNDLRGILALRAERKNANKDAVDGFNSETKARQEAFTLEQEARVAASRERIAQIQAEVAAYATATQARIQVEAASIQQRQALEAQAFADQQAKDQAARELRAQRDAEDAAIRQRYQEEDRAITAQREQEALTKRLAAIDQEQARLAQLAGLTITARTLEISLLDQIIAKASNALTTLNAQGATAGAGNVLGFLSNIGQTIGNVLGLPGRASGGVVSAGQSYIVGERQAEVFKPATDGYIFPSIAAARGVGGGSSVSVTIGAPQMNFPTGVTPEQAQAIATDVSNAMAKQLGGAVTNALRRAQRING